MPLYKYICPNGHSVEQIRKVSDRDNAFTCNVEGCGKETKLIFSAPAPPRIIGGTPKHH